MKFWKCIISLMLTASLPVQSQIVLLGLTAKLDRSGQSFPSTNPVFFTEPLQTQPLTRVHKSWVECNGDGPTQCKPLGINILWEHVHGVSIRGNGLHIRSQLVVSQRNT